MDKMKRGFTLVEVALFLAVTGVLFVGIAMGVQNSIFQQRYTDAVQSFAEFLRSAYSETMNVENSVSTGGGRSEMAIYGKLLTFGESTDLSGNSIPDSEDAIFSYTVVGKIGDLGTGDVKTSLKELGVSVTDEKGGVAGIAERYLPRWGSEIQTTKAYNGSGYEKYKGAVLVVRHPRTGTVFTYVMNGEIEINKTIQSDPKANPLLSNLDNFQPEEVDFCVNPNGANYSSVRRDVRLIANARNASGVEIIEQDGEDNKCEYEKVLL